MKKITMIALLGVSSLSYAGVSDASGYIWTPDGEYASNRAMAEFDTAKRYGMLSMGNGCVLEGRLSQPNKKKPVFVLKNIVSDGVECPSLKQVTITILDGPAVRAEGNASKIKISHPAQKGRVNFSGTYRFQ